MVRISAIKYLNTIPFIYGLESCDISKSIVMDFCTPAESANKLIHDKTDLGIVPVAIIPSLKDAHVISNFCIGATAEVASVLLCSGTPINEINEIFLDNDSMTSVLLTKILCRDYWKISPYFSPVNITNSILDSSKSYLLIGDKAMLNRGKFKYVYDLAAEWISFKKKPFVFACWTANKPLDKNFIFQFNEALEYGINHIPQAIEKYNIQFSKEFALNYLSTNISYLLDRDKRAGLTEFWRIALEILNPRVCWL
ncbi:MAG: menaquinone biosynthesis protein [Bacteroidales bacterium]|nr:menaquinone biosynthesis protein [Bacteroidales bacterium]